LRGFRFLPHWEMSQLPDWANEAINEACQSKAWHALIADMQLHLKSAALASSSSSAKITTKRFYEYNELEQAVLVEQELKKVYLLSSFLFGSLVLLISWCRIAPVPGQSSSERLQSGPQCDRRRQAHGPHRCGGRGRNEGLKCPAAHDLLLKNHHRRLGVLATSAPVHRQAILEPVCSLLSPLLFTYAHRL
jgi:hypothetical protein